MSYNSKGLTQAQAAARLEQVGPGRLAEGPKTSMAGLFFSQFKDVMILILAAATLASAALGQTAEAIAIIAVMLVNAVLGFVQEYRTEKTLEALKALNAPTARVYRDGQVCQIPAEQVVPGDVLVLAAGDRIAADCRLDSGAGVCCDESMLTGESVPVHKQPSDPLYMGCTMAAGRGEAVVTATGMATEMGKIAHLVQHAGEGPTPLQLRLRALGRWVAAVCLAVCLGVALLGMARGGGFLPMLLTGVSLAVAAVPEGLPAIVTVTLALSVGRILRRGAVIRRLHAVETLGCAGVICTDKTGTITQNKMTVQRLELPGHSYTVTGPADGAGCVQENGRTVELATQPALRWVLEAGALMCTDASVQIKGNTFQTTGDPTEAALLVAAAKCGITRQEVFTRWRTENEQPFDAVRKRMSLTAVPLGGGAPVLLCKGAPEAVLARCTHVAAPGGVRPMTPGERAQIQSKLAQMADGALRVLALASSDAPGKGEESLCWLGMAGMMDPPRPQVAPAVRRCRSAGIKPVMITGDAPQTALAIARQVGIARPQDGLLTGAQLDEMDDRTLAAQCMNISVYARVTPAHKLRIVRAYQAAGQITAMTGDGVNDAPAVKAADIGVAMGISGTDVTKQASGVVILDDNFATIVAAVEEGRVIYRNIRRFIRYLLASNLGEVLCMALAMVLGLPVAMTPIQILLVNLFTDGLPAVALGLEPTDDQVMRQPPRPKDEGLFARGLGRAIAIQGVAMGAACAGAYALALSLWGDLALARTVCFAVVVLSQLVHLFQCRSGPLRANPVLTLAAGGSAVLTLLCVYLPWAQGPLDTVALGAPALALALGASLLANTPAVLHRLLSRH